MTPATRSGHPPGPATTNYRVLKTAKIKITTMCNRSCDFCIFSAGSAGTNMSLETFSTILKRLDVVPYLQLHINGGEPTLHKEFVPFSHQARTAAGARAMVLGTNAITIARNQRLLSVVMNCYDQVLIGCDEEHDNYDHVAKVIPILRAAGKIVVINSVRGKTPEERVEWLADLCHRHGAIHVINQVHHIDVGQATNPLKGLCLRNVDQHLMIQEDGSCYRCFNAMAAVDSEFSIWDADFTDRLFSERAEHYQFCRKCHEYQDSGVQPRRSKLR